MGIIQKSVAEELEKQAATAVKKVQDFNAEHNTLTKEKETTEETIAEQEGKTEEPLKSEEAGTQEPATAEEKKKVGRTRKSRK